MTVYVVSIEDSYGDSSCIHSVVATEELAKKEIQELSSRLNNCIATYEPHEVVE